MNQATEAESVSVSKNESINKLQLALNRYLINTYLFVPRYGFYLVSRNFPEGARVRAGDEIFNFTLSPPKLPNVIPMFLDSSSSNQVRPGMKVLLTPVGISRAEFGGIKGKVVEIFKLPLQGSGLQGAVGSLSLSSVISRAIPLPVLAQVRLEQNSKQKCKGASSFNCYIWSSSQTPPHPVRIGSIADVQVTTISRAPIEFVMPFFRKLAGLVVEN